MILLNKLTLNKKIVPAYVFKFYLAFIIFTGVWFLTALPATVVVGLIYDESPVTYITMGVAFGIFAVGMIVLLVLGAKLRGRLVSEFVEKLEEEYADMPLETASRILTERGVINNTGFILNGDVFDDKKVFPFEKLDYFVYAVAYDVKCDGHSVKEKPRYDKIDIYLSIHYANDEGIVEAVSRYEVDGALYNFLDKKELITDYEENREFALLKFDRENFVRSAFGFRLK